MTKKTITLLIVLLLIPSQVLAKIEDSPKYAALIIDAKDNIILHEVNADQPRYPASLTKLMTLYLTFDAVKQGYLNPGQTLKVSERAASQPPTKIYLKADERVSVEDCIRGLIIKSANDCAIVLADAIADTEYFFTMKMTKIANKLGLKNTRFVNAHGLPDKRQRTTAHDIAKLALALKRDFPEYYHYFGETVLYFRDQEYPNHSNITNCYVGAKGMKAGYINDSGYNLVSVVKRDGKEIMAIVMGGDTWLERDRHMAETLNKYFPPEIDQPWANIYPKREKFASRCDRLGIVEME